MKISLCMIVKNEQAVLARCLESAKALVDEIIIADTGSTDKTVEIASRYVDKVVSVPWTDDFAAARNASFSHATGDYLMWLDADDYISPEDAEQFPALRKMLEEKRPDVVFCRYQTGGLVYERERILKHVPLSCWRGRVHECIAPFGCVVHDPFTVTHLPGDKEKGMRNLNIYRKWAESEKLSGRDLFYYGRELYYHGFYAEAIAILGEMLDGDGWYVNKIEACKVLSACFRETGRKNDALSALFRSFLYGEPRAGILCDIGAIFKEKKRYREAAFWYARALESADHSAEGDFELPACRTYIPALELTFLYYALGDREKAYAYHKQSEAFAPDHPSVSYNRTFFGD